jgi:hypothetical protein
MQNQNKIGLLKYHVVVEWPPTCRNRSPKTLQHRPDLVHKMNEYVKKIISICESYKTPIQVDQSYNMLGVRTWWQEGSDLYHFLMTQEQNKLNVIPEIGVLNQLTGKLVMFKFSVDKNGITLY